jgi:four helix bundle protein
MAKGDDIQARLMAFAQGAMDICDLLPKTTAGNHIAGQLLRSATSAASNYAEARGAESKCDFIHKLGLAFKELNESEVWLELILSRKMIACDLVANVLEECKILCRIVAASRRTALYGRQPSAMETDQPGNFPGW